MLSREERERKILLMREKKIRKARKDFWEFCKLLHSDFYKEDREYLKDYCQMLQNLYERKIINDKSMEAYTKACISFPPRHGKSRTLILFCCWAYGQDINNMILYLSYSDEAATDFSRYVRDEILKEKSMLLSDFVFSDVFEKARIKDGDGAVQKWSLEGRHFSYKAAGIGGAITGKGATIIIVDDPIKNSFEAFSKHRKQEIVKWLTGTVFSRAEAGCLEIINMTRWASDDPIGHVTNSADGHEWYVYKKNACDNEGNMLCPSILDKKRLDYLVRNGDPTIIQANYFNKLIDETFLMYPNLKRFDKYSHVKYEKTINATDTADKGADFFSAPVGKVLNGQIYIYDWLYTQEDTETTPGLFAKMLYENKVNYSRIESNAGGNILGNYVKDLLWRDYQTRAIDIETFPSTKNKEARIRDTAQWIVNNVFFPEDFHITHPQIWQVISQFLRVGKNDHDDGPDSLTMLAEMVMNLNDDPFAGL